MATIEEQLLLTLDTKNLIKSALIEKGADLTGKKFAEYPEVIKKIKGGNNWDDLELELIDLELITQNFGDSDYIYTIFKFEGDVSGEVALRLDVSDGKEYWEVCNSTLKVNNLPVDVYESHYNDEANLGYSHYLYLGWNNGPYFGFINLTGLPYLLFTSTNNWELDPYVVAIITNKSDNNYNFSDKSAAYSINEIFPLISNDDKITKYGYLLNSVYANHPGELSKITIEITTEYADDNYDNYNHKLLES